MRKTSTPCLSVTIYVVIFVIFSSTQLRSAAADPRVVEDLVRQMTQIMDTNVDPCEDFEKYVCGNWDQYFSTDPALGFQSIPRYTELSLMNNVADLLAGDNPPVPLGAGSRMWARDYFRSCMNKSSERDIRSLIDALVPIGGWNITSNTGFDPYLWDHRMSLKVAQTIFGWDTLFSWRLDDNTGTLYIELTPNPRMVYHEDLERPLQSRARTWINQVLFKTFGFADGQKNKEKIELERTGMTIDEMLSDRVLEQEMTVKTLGEIFPFLDWAEFFGDAFGVGGREMKSVPVRVRDIKYFEKLNKFILNMITTTEGKTKLANYIGFQVMHYIHLEKFRRFGRLVEEDHSDDRIKCSAKTFRVFRDSVSAMLHELHFGPRALEHAEDILDYVKKALHIVMSNSPWMDKATFSTLRTKFESMKTFFITERSEKLEEEDQKSEYKEFRTSPHRSFIGDSIKLAKIDTALLRGHFLEPDVYPSILQYHVNACMNPQYNILVVCLGQLVAPIFHPDYPRSVNFGGLGYTIGHELIHNFDNEGRNYGGAEMGDWWTNRTSEKFKQMRDELLELQARFYDRRPSIDFTRTFDENMADIGGLKTSYRAYKDWSKRNDPGVSPLARFGMNHDQTFFVRVAQLYCSTLSFEEQVNKFTDDHPPDTFRIFNTMSNSEEFARAFSCAKGSRYNPERKSRLFWTPDEQGRTRRN